MNTKSPTQHLTLSIDGMSCQHCVQAVSEALAAAPGVTVRSVAIGSAEVLVADAAAAAGAVRAIEEAGYTARTAAPSTMEPARTGCGCGCGSAPRTR